NTPIKWETKVFRIHDIAKGISQIHEQGLIHRDLHGGNILNNKGLQDPFFGDSIVQLTTMFKRDNFDGTRISDLGLCQPIDQKGKDSETYGVLSYVAPEVLGGEGYTLASDMYSFGSLMYEVGTGCPPFSDQPHNAELA